jgi:YtkA-like
MAQGMHHGAGAAQAAPQHGMADHKGMGHEPQMQHSGDMKPADHLMGHKHGEDIPTGEDMLCVPIGDMASTSWKSMSDASDLNVTANSVSGALAHNSRANESLSFTIMRDGKPVEQADVRVVARMPHHDHGMPGGHGPANDPDVQGLEAMPEGNGVYLLPTIDFSMGGAWLFEVDVQESDTMHKAYFASEIGEE